MHKGQVVVQAH